MKEPATLSLRFDFTRSAEKRLKALKLKTEAESYLEVVQNALRLYEGLIEESEKGIAIFVQKDGAFTPFRLWKE